jgi:hypothetical protein
MFGMLLASTPSGSLHHRTTEKRDELAPPHVSRAE